jgi:hypothetical protein
LDQQLERSKSRRRVGLGKKRESMGAAAALRKEDRRFSIDDEATTEIADLRRVVSDEPPVDRVGLGMRPKRCILSTKTLELDIELQEMP